MKFLMMKTMSCKIIRVGKYRVCVEYRKQMMVTCYGCEYFYGDSWQLFKSLNRDLKQLEQNITLK